MKWSHLLNSMYNVRANIYRYRSRVGEYAPSKGGAAIEEVMSAYYQAQEEAKRAQLAKLQLQQEAGSGAQTPTTGSELSSANNKAGTAMKGQQKGIFGKNIDEKAADSAKKKKEERQSARAAFAEALEDINRDTFASELRISSLIDAPVYVWKEVQATLYPGAPPKSSLWNLLCCCFTNSRSSKVHAAKLLEDQGFQFGRDEGPASQGQFGGIIINDEDLLDDGISVITAEDYVSFRLLPAISAYQLEAPALESKLQRLQLLIFVCTVASSALGAFGSTNWIPFVVVTLAAFQNLMEYTSLQVRLAACNAALCELNNARLWWQSLSIYERRGQANKETLVQTTEETILNEVASYLKAVRTTGSRKFAKKGYADGSEEDKQDGNEGQGTTGRSH